MAATSPASIVRKIFRLIPIKLILSKSHTTRPRLSHEGAQPLRRANRRQPPRSVQFLSPFPAASCRSRRRSTDESPLTSASSKAARIARSVGPMSRALRWVPAKRLAGLLLRRLPRRPNHRFHMGPAPFRESSLPWRYAHQLLSHRRASDATGRRRTIRSYERRFDRGFQD